MEQTERQPNPQAATMRAAKKLLSLSTKRRKQGWDVEVAMMIEKEIHWSEIEQALSDTLLFLNEFGNKDRTVEDNLEFAEFLRGRILDALHNVTCDENECGYKSRKAKMTGKATAKF